MGRTRSSANADRHPYARNNFKGTKVVQEALRGIEESSEDTLPLLTDAQFSHLIKQRKKKGY